MERLRLPPGARADLLRVLNSPSDVRADVIRQFHERGEEGPFSKLREVDMGSVRPPRGGGLVLKILTGAR